MKYIKYTYLTDPVSRGPVLPDVEGVQYIWTRSTAKDRAEFYGTCPDEVDLYEESGELKVGILAVYEQHTWEALIQADKDANTKPKKTLEELKLEKNEWINQKRLEANRSSFTHEGKSFACDELSRSDIDGTNGFVSLYGALPPGWVGGWKAIDNTYLAISTVDEWKSFYTSMFAAGSANFAKAQGLKARLAEVTTEEELNLIVWD